jgi:hypothetical protein
MMNCAASGSERALGEPGARLALNDAMAAARKYGSQGAASACRRIDPRTGEVVEVIEPKRPGERKPRSRQAPS